MKQALSKSETQTKVKEFFSQSEGLDPKRVKKIKTLAMKYNIKLGDHKKRFCKKCYSDLKNGKVRITKTHKTVECLSCGEKNRFKLS